MIVYNVQDRDAWRQRAFAAEAAIEKVRELHDALPGSDYRLALGIILLTAKSA